MPHTPHPLHPHHQKTCSNMKPMQRESIDQQHEIPKVHRITINLR